MGSSNTLGGGPGRAGRVLNTAPARLPGADPPCHNPAVGSLRFTAELVPRGPAAAVVLDDQQVAAVGEGAKRFPVLARVNGYAWRTSVARMRGEYVLGLSRAVRDAAGAQAGDEVDVELELDSAPREVDVPEPLAAALAEEPAARAAFDALAYTHRKEYARWVQQAKHEDTRARRVAQTIEKLRRASQGSTA
jgi:hypothetical protein